MQDEEPSWSETLNRTLGLMRDQLDTINRIVDAYVEEDEEDPEDPEEEEEEEDDESTATEIWANAAASESDPRNGDNGSVVQIPLRVAAENTP